MHDAEEGQAPGRIAGLPTWLLARASARGHRLLTEALAAHGLRGHHYRLLAALEEAGPSSQTALGQRTGLDRSDVVAAVNHLQSRALITRSIDAQDRRRNTIALTAAGDEELVRLHQVVAGVQDALLAHLAPRDRTALNRLLRRLNDPPG